MKDRDCDTCGNGQRDVFDRLIPRDQKRCQRCVWGWGRRMMGPDMDLELLWYPKGVIRIWDERPA